VKSPFLRRLFDASCPPITGLPRLPQVSERRRRHVRAANDVVSPADRFFSRTSAEKQTRRPTVKMRYAART
jgi:hypothetical protein